MPQLVPEDSLTQRLVVEVLVKMYKHKIKSKRAAATSEFPRPDVATASTQSAITDPQADSNIVTTSSQNDEKEL